ncbi:MAG: hypothetical protein Q8S33_14725 [Myxococcales bacterium]|nr:hypothetical protein [Myxococcales bacterium]
MNWRELKLDEWTRGDEALRAVVLDAIESELIETFAPAHAYGVTAPLPMLIHRETSHEFLLVFGGTFTMGRDLRDGDESGLSLIDTDEYLEEHEREDVGAWTVDWPARSVTVGPFLMAVHAFEPIAAPPIGRDPTEAEWEYVLNAGLVRALPSHEHPFGFASYGVQPERCGEAFRWCLDPHWSAQRLPWMVLAGRPVRSTTGDYRKPRVRPVVSL